VDFLFQISTCAAEFEQRKQSARIGIMHQQRVSSRVSNPTLTKRVRYYCWLGCIRCIQASTHPETQTSRRVMLRTIFRNAHGHGLGPRSLLSAKGQVRVLVLPCALCSVLCALCSVLCALCSVLCLYLYLPDTHPHPPILPPPPADA
jgi:hypothetical protein